MTMGVRAPADFGAGLLLLGMGVAALWVGRDWRAGSLAEMDTGFFPRLLGGILVLGGLALAARSFVLAGEGVPAFSWRPVTAVTAGIIGFGAAIDRFGLAVAIFIVIASGVAAGARLSLLSFTVLWAALTAMCAAIFVWGVALPIDVWPL